MIEVSYDQITGERFRHATRFERWRPDKSAQDCTMDQLQRPEWPRLRGSRRFGLTTSVRPMADRKTKIIATLGPATFDPEIILQLVGAGMDVARLNFSHGDQQTHRQSFEWVRAASLKAGRPVAIMQDIQGPKIRVGELAGGGGIELAEGEIVTLVGDGRAGSHEVIPVGYLEHVHGLSNGDSVFLVDGRVELTVVEAGTEITARVLRGGPVGSKQGAAFPGTRFEVPAVTDKDADDLVFGAELGVDYVAASFVSNADDIRRVRELNSQARVIAKLERALAHKNLDEIAAESDGVMVARGDLGVEMTFEVLPRIQKEIINKTNALGKISITATEMLETMRTSSRPTRAEVSDVANAVFDGTDAVMLSSETAVGAHPIQAVEVMHRICVEAELAVDERPDGEDFMAHEFPIASALTKAAAEVADNLGIETIVVFTTSGRTARLLSKYRPHAQIAAITTNLTTYNRMAFFHGVVPKLLNRDYPTADEMDQAASRLLQADGLFGSSDTILMVAGVPKGSRTNVIRVHQVGSEFVKE